MLRPFSGRRRRTADLYGFSVKARIIGAGSACLRRHAPDCQRLIAARLLVADERRRPFRFDVFPADGWPNEDVASTPKMTRRCR